jgi:glycosyltransferase involved in cell wall biosynthesis
VWVSPSVLTDARVVLKYLKDYDLLIANTILAYRTIFAAAAINKPSLWWVHESTFGLEFINQHPTVGQALTLADTVLFPSKFNQEQYNKYSNHGNFHFIWTGVDVEWPAEVTDISVSQQQDLKTKVVLIGSMESRKGQDILIKAIQSLPGEVVNNFEFFFIGQLLDKWFQTRVNVMARRLKNVHILGEVPSGEVMRFLKEADIYVLPSRDEALPVTLIEAMALGRTVIATRVGGVPEIIEDNVNGVLIESEDYKTLSEQLLKLNQDTELAHRLGQNAYLTYRQKLTFSRFASQMMQLMDQTLAQSRQ